MKIERTIVVRDLEDIVFEEHETNKELRKLIRAEQVKLY